MTKQIFITLPQVRKRISRDVWNKLTESSSCPIRTQMFGGILTVGGYDDGKEYLVGGREIAEAAHCILGSLGKQKDWKTMLKVEQGHIEEEMDIIDKTIKEYSKPVYGHDMVDFSDYKKEYQERERKSAEKTVAEIKKQSPVLRELAKKQLKKWKQQTDVPKEIKVVGEQSYLLLIELADSLEFSVKDYPKQVNNAYQKSTLRTAAQKLRQAIDAMFKSKIEVETKKHLLIPADNAKE